MSSLNLVPNPTVMLVQAGLFVANFVVIKKLILEPYLSVYDRQQAKTTGSQSEAERLDLESIDLEKKIAAAIDTTKDNLAEQRQAALKAARSESEAVVAAAETSANQTIETMRQEVAATIAEERAKIPGIVEEMSELVVQRVLEA